MLKEIAHKDLNDVLKMLKEALNAVENIYIEQEYRRVRAGFQNPENSFVAELYHQLRILQVAPQYESFSRLRFNFDIGKKMYAVNRSIPCLANFYRKNIRPDLIFHKAQNNLDEQKLACEIKTNKNLKFYELAIDLQKLVYYKTSRLKFENAVFVYTGEPSNIKDLLSRFIKQNPTSILNCLHKHCILFALPKSKENNTNQWGIYAIDLGNGINEGCFQK